jgi:LPXTG-motif cell wall-anchored protein
VMKVTGNGTEIPVPPSTGGEPEGDDDFNRGPHESGCGCKTIAETTMHGTNGYAALGIALALGVTAASRRRRRRDQ